jgi:hypothetical protein
MGRLDAWKVTEELITDLRRKGTIIPNETMTELRSAKTLIHVLEVDPSQTDVGLEIDKCLFNVESYVMSEGQAFGAEYVEKWSARLSEALGALEEVHAQEEEPKLLPNIPRGAKWIRISSSALSMDELRKLADDLHLSCMVQNEDVMLVHGEDKMMRELVKGIAAKYEKSRWHEQIVHPSEPKPEFDTTHEDT